MAHVHNIKLEESESKACQCQDDNQASSLFLGLMGTPFESDWTTTVFRLIEATLKANKTVAVWTCGYSTQITQKGYVRPADPIHPDSPSKECAYTLTELVESLLQKYPDLLRWYVCRYCMEERGASDQIAGVDILLPFSFNSYLNQADKSLVLGMK